jgi:DMSO/TMAO reductase YedYZ molybdopterin-dependent catalytic subunit
MVFAPLHWIPSLVAAVLTIALALTKGRPPHKILARVMILFALVGLFGYLQRGDFRLLALDLHAFHSWTGLAALIISVYVFSTKKILHKNVRHCHLGRAAALLAAVALTTGLSMLTGLAPSGPNEVAPPPTLQAPASSDLPEVEAVEYAVMKLTPLDEQGNNAIEGTQQIDRETYRLKVTGLVDEEIEMSYDDLLNLPAYSEFVRMPCVEGWGFDAKWTGFLVVDLLDEAGLRPEAAYVVFHSADGYSTGLDLDYLKEENVLLAYGINDVTLPPERGFPLQVVAKGKYGYKWAKWVTEIEVVAEERRGFWESRGYSNSANVGEFPFG